MPYLNTTYRSNVWCLTDAYVPLEWMARSSSSMLLIVTLAVDTLCCRQLGVGAFAAAVGVLYTVNVGIDIVWDCCDEVSHDKHGLQQCLVDYCSSLVVTSVTDHCGILVVFWSLVVPVCAWAVLSAADISLSSRG